LKVFKKVIYWYFYYLFMTLRKVEIDGVEELLEKVVTKDGKVGGLLRHAGKTVLIVVPFQELKKSK
jgi:hypothetical protein